MYSNPNPTYNVKVNHIVGTLLVEMKMAVVVSVPEGLKFRSRIFLSL